MAFGIACSSCDSSDEFRRCAFFGSERVFDWLEHAFFPLIYSGLVFAFFSAFGHLNEFFLFAFKSFFGNALIKGEIEKPS